MCLGLIVREVNVTRRMGVLARGWLGGWSDRGLPRRESIPHGKESAVVLVDIRLVEWFDEVSERVTVAHKFIVWLARKHDLYLNILGSHKPSVFGRRGGGS